ncbi:MAG: gamma-glutamyl-gamma-aminobutyrate hydrolase family protein [Bifidobacteriaceae bacterium]|nr:gamma-glutamyl-gamma-aminobutyrate hydrolase family protein [Bifidobacteriaceae bacterium]
MEFSEGGLIEAVYKPDQSFLWAVQWHPEFSWKTDENSRKIFHAFISAAK